MKYKKGFYCRELEISSPSYPKIYFDTYYWDGKVLELLNAFGRGWEKSSYANFEALISVLKGVHANHKIALHYLGE